MAMKQPHDVDGQLFTRTETQNVKQKCLNF